MQSERLSNSQQEARKKRINPRPAYPKSFGYLIEAVHGSKLQIITTNQHSGDEGRGRGQDESSVPLPESRNQPRPGPARQVPEASTRSQININKNLPKLAPERSRRTPSRKIMRFQIEKIIAPAKLATT